MVQTMAEAGSNPTRAPAEAAGAGGSPLRQYLHKRLRADADGASASEPKKDSKGKGKAAGKGKGAMSTKDLTSMVSDLARLVLVHDDSLAHLEATLFLTMIVPDNSEVVKPGREE